MIVGRNGLFRNSFRVGYVYKPLYPIRYIETKVEREKKIKQVQKMLRKEGLKKKVRRRFKAELRYLELTDKIQTSGEAKKAAPPNPEEKSIRQQFKELPYDQKILDYIHKHSLHRLKAPPQIRQTVNSFVDKVFDTDQVRVRVCKTEDRYPTYPEGERHPEIALVGRSNVGKSSVLRALLPRIHPSKVPKISYIPGQTRAIHFLQLKKLTIVDLPGYGYTVKENKADQWNMFTQHYLENRPKLRRICVLIDSRHGFKSADLEYLDFLEKCKKKYQIVLTKADLMEPEDLARIYTQVKEEIAKRKLRRCLDRVMIVSSFTKAGIPILKKELASLAYEGPQLMERDHLRIGEPKVDTPRIGYGINSLLRNRQHHVYGKRGRISTTDKGGRAGRPRH